MGLSGRFVRFSMRASNPAENNRAGEPSSKRVKTEKTISPGNTRDTGIRTAMLETNRMAARALGLRDDTLDPEIPKTPTAR